MSLTLFTMLAKLGIDTRDFSTGLDGAAREADNAGRSISENLSNFGGDFVSLGDSVLKWSGLAVGAIGAAGSAMLGLAGAFTVNAVRVATSLESAFAGVVKTTDGLTSEVGVLNDAGKELKEGFKALSEQIPITPEQLMRIGELGGQLGIEKGNLLAFTETVAGIGVSTDLAAEEAAMGFARMMNIMGTAQGDVGRIGSAVVALGNNFATTEPDIMNFALRIAGAGQIAGLTEADVLAIGAAMSSVGVEAEAGGTAVQKVLLGINTAVVSNSAQLEVFAETAGMSASAFAAAWEADPATAFAAFVAGLGAQGDEAIFTLEELELTDQRLVRSFLSLAGSGDLLTNALDMSSGAWEENTALATEAAQRYATSESKMAIFRNSITNLKDDIGSAFLPVLGDMLGMLGELVDQYAPLVVSWFEERIAPAVETLVGAFGDLLAGDVAGFLDGVQGALAGLVGAEAAQAIWDVATAIGELIAQAAAFVQEHAAEFRGALIGIGAVLTAAAIASIGVSIAALANPITAIIAAGALLGAAWAGDWGGIQTKTLEAIEAIKGFIAPFLETVRAWWDGHGAAVLGAVTVLWDGIKAHIDLVINLVRGIIQTIMALIQGDWDGAWTGILDTAISFLDTIKNAIDTALAAVANIFGLNREEVQGTVDGLWGDVETAVWTALGVVQDAIDGVLAFILGLWDTHGASVMAVLENSWAIIQTIIDTALGVIEALTTAWTAAREGDWYAFGEAIRTAVDTLWEGIEGVFTLAFDSIKIIAETGLEILTTVFSGGWELLKEAVTGLVTSITSAFTSIDWAATGSAIIDGIKGGVTSAATSLADAARNAANSALDAVKGFLGIESPSKVAAKEIGRPFSAGIGAGILSGMADLARDVLPNISATLTAPVSTPSLGPLEGRGDQYNYVLHNTFARPDDPRRIEHIISALEAAHG